MALSNHYTRKELSSSRDLSILCSSNVRRKEYYETEQTLKKSIKVLRTLTGIHIFKNIYDFCSGHTFNAFYALSRDYAKHAVVFDHKFPKASCKIESYYPRLLPRVQHVEEDIFTHQYNLQPNSFIISIHPCRELAYRVSEIAIQNKLPIVIVPCCPGGSRKLSWLDAFSNINDYDRHAMKVAEFLSSHNYSIKIREINEKYTPRNKIIIGIP